MADRRWCDEPATDTALTGITIVESTYDVLGVNATGDTITPALSPFDNTALSYTASVHYRGGEYLTFQPVFAHPFATAKVYLDGDEANARLIGPPHGTTGGAVPLVQGANTVKLKVIAQDGTTNRVLTEAPTSVATLIGFGVVPQQGTLNPRGADVGQINGTISGTTGAVTVRFRHSPVKVQVYRTSMYSAIAVNGVNVPCTVDACALSQDVVIPAVGNTNTFTVLVSADNCAVGGGNACTQVTYTMTVTRSAGATNADLSAIATAVQNDTSVGQIAPAFAAATTAYAATVPYGECKYDLALVRSLCPDISQNITVTPTPSDPLFTSITVGGAATYMENALNSDINLYI